MKSKKKTMVTILIIALSGALLLGGISMIIKKTVKEGTYQLVDIQTINISANTADINISLTGGGKLEIIQYSQKKVDATFHYDTAIENGVLTVRDNSGKAPYFFGVEGNPGVSYEIQLPASYSGSLQITLNQGNLVMSSGSETFTLNSIHIENIGTGDINIDTLAVTADSTISGGRGNINLTLSGDIKVNAQTGTGNVTVADIFSSGTYEMIIKNARGNITVESTRRDKN